MNNLGKYNPFLKPLHLCDSNSFKQKHYVAQTEFLIEHLDDLVELTKAHVPGRAHGFQLERKNEAALANSESRDERHVEYRIYDKFKGLEKTEEQLHLLGLTHIPYYQFPLCSDEQSRITNKKRKEINAGWGEVDLLGCSEKTHMPAVIELKIFKAQPETPLRMIVEGMAYAIAIREMWNQENNKKFREAWANKLGQNTTFDDRNIKVIDVIGLAPSSYWNHWETKVATYKQSERNWNSATKRLIEKAESENLGLRIKLISFDEGNAQTPPSNFKDITDEFCIRAQ
jgi:hypothetical protein